MSAARKRLFYARGLWENDGAHKMRRSAMSSFEHFVSEMNVPKMQQACGGVP